MPPRYRKKSDMRILLRFERLANARSAMTLVELLVVVMILLILMGISAAAIRPLVQGRDIRESARLLNTFLARAQSRAIERGRPVAVVFERLANNPAIVLEVFQSDVPPPYAGELLDDVVSIEPYSPASPSIGNWGKATFSGTLGNIEHRLRVGDLIKFNYRGAKYVIKEFDLSVPYVIFYHQSAPLAISGANGLPFQIYHLGVGFSQSAPSNPSPLHFTVTPPLQFPDSVVIDVSISGIGPYQQFNSNDQSPISLVFSPEGRIAYLGSAFVDEEYNVIRPLQSVHFLLGRADQLGPENLADLNNMWVSVGHQSGRVITTENAPIHTTNPSPADRLKESRRYALGGRAAGGR